VRLRRTSFPKNGFLISWSTLKEKSLRNEIIPQEAIAYTQEFDLQPQHCDGHNHFHNVVYVQ